jgi:hypothetical protein
VAVWQVPFDDLKDSGSQFVMGAKPIADQTYDKGVPNPYGAGASALSRTLRFTPRARTRCSRVRRRSLTEYDAVDKAAEDAAAADLASRANATNVCKRTASLRGSGG